MTKERRTVREVQMVMAVVGGDAVMEEMIMKFIAEKYGARDLFSLPEKVVREIVRRPGDFVRAVKRHFQPELEF